MSDKKRKSFESGPGDCCNSFERDWDYRQFDSKAWDKYDFGDIASQDPMVKFEIDVYDIADQLAELLISKQKDYGPLNIARAPGGPLNGLRVRLFDKIQRLSHLVDTNKDPEHESLKDTFMDIANYGIIGLMVLEDKWSSTVDKDI